MKSNWKASLTAVILMLQVALPSQVLAGTKRSLADEWSVQVGKVELGRVNIESAFRVAIYENLLDELAKTKQFKRVLRSGDRNATGLPDLLILKTTVEEYAPGSETRRAVTTVSGATKLKVRSQLCTREGQIVLERVLSGNVRFFGGNLRATHNLARKVADAIKQSTLPEIYTFRPANSKHITGSPTVCWVPGFGTSRREAGADLGLFKNLGFSAN
jgi:hypothetical protein